MMMDVEIIYNMAKAAARSAELSLEKGNYPGYPAHIDAYNRLIPLLIEQFGEEAKNIFRPVDPGRSPTRSLPTEWASYLALAVTRLNEMVAFLQTKSGETDRQVEGIIDLIKINLRPAIYEDPKNEREVQNALETIFRVRGFDFPREKITIPYSSKTYIPDFTFESLALAAEAKLCYSKKKEKEIIDEVNADIPAYQTRYKHVIFIVYDLGFIRDVDLFKSGIKSNPDVYIEVIKK